MSNIEHEFEETLGRLESVVEELKEIASIGEDRGIVPSLVRERYQLLADIYGEE